MSDDLYFDSPQALLEARNAIFAQSLDRIFPHHPFYARRFKKYGIGRNRIGGLDDLHALPLTGKADYVAAPADFTLALPVNFDPDERIVWDVMYTTGSTGEPTPFTSTSYDFLNILALQRNMLALRGVTGDDTILNLFPLTRHPHGAFARAMNAAAALNIPIVAALPGAPSTRHADLGNRMEDVIALAGRCGATILWGVPSYIRKMLGRAEELGTTMPTVRLVFVTGEGFGEEARDDLVSRLKRLGASDPKISVSYGATEMQGGMVECRPGAGYHNPAPLQFWFEAVDPHTHAAVADGEEGMILLTHLDRRGTTMLRYALGDTARLTRQRCPHCGALTERLASVPVRHDGFVKIKGMLVNPQALSDLLAADPDIADFQAIVDKEDEADALSMDRLRVRGAVRGARDAAAEKRIVEKVKATTGVTPVVEFAEVDDAAFTGRGWKAKPLLDLRKRPQ